MFARAYGPKAGGPYQHAVLVAIGHYGQGGFLRITAPTACGLFKRRMWLVVRGGEGVRRRILGLVEGKFWIDLLGVLGFG